MKPSVVSTAPVLGLLCALGLAAGAASLPSCGGNDNTPKPDGGTGGATPDGGTGGVGGAPYIPPEKCKPIGAANEVAAGDPRAQGQCIFLLDTWGAEDLDQWPPTDFMLALMKDEPQVFGNQFASFGFVPDPNDDLPVGFKRGLANPAKVHETCAICHTAKLPDGRTWLGAPNGKLDFGRFKVEVNKRWVAAGHAPLLSAFDEQKSLLLGPGRTDAESGDYPIAVPADFPTYFDLDKRTHLNYLGTGHDARTESYFAIYAFGPGSPNDQTAKVPFPPDEPIETMMAFLTSLQAPVGPPPDAALVSQGKAVFTSARCDTCHHVGDVGKDDITTYDKDQTAAERYPGDDPAFPRGSIHTDIFHRALLDSSVIPDGGLLDGGSDAGSDNGYADLIAFIIAHHLSTGPTDGYRVTDLSGLWATAPYLHNGSVPTLDDLLKKGVDRPVTFMREGFLVDTTVPANGNQGHEFGTTLSDTDKAALVAYLESL